MHSRLNACSWQWTRNSLCGAKSNGWIAGGLLFSKMAIIHSRANLLKLPVHLHCPSCGMCFQSDEQFDHKQTSQTGHQHILCLPSSAVQPEGLQHNYTGEVPLGGCHLHTCKQIHGISHADCIWQAQGQADCCSEQKESRFCCSGSPTSAKELAKMCMLRCAWTG